MTGLTKKSLVATIILSALFLTVLFKNEPKLQAPLLNMEIENAVPKNTVLMTGVPIIKDELKDNVLKGNYILQGNVVIPEKTTVKIEANTVFYANRDARVIVHGKLIANDVTWQSNQAYAQRRYWYGLTAENGGEITLVNNHIQDATTAITALSNGKITLSGILTKNIVGMATLENGEIKTGHLQITNGTVGVLALGGKTVLEKTIFAGLSDGLRIFHDSDISIDNPTFSRIQKNNIHYLDEPTATNK